MLCHSTPSSPASQADSLEESGAPQRVSFPKPRSPRGSSEWYLTDTPPAACCDSVSGLQICWVMLLSAHIDFPVDFITSNHKGNCAPLLECQGKMNSKHFPAGTLALPSKAGHCPCPTPSPNLSSPTQWKSIRAEVGHRIQLGVFRMPNYAAVRSIYGPTQGNLPLSFNKAK